MPCKPAEPNPRFLPCEPANYRRNPLKCCVRRRVTWTGDAMKQDANNSAAPKAPKMRTGGRLVMTILTSQGLVKGCR